MMEEQSEASGGCPFCGSPVEHAVRIGPNKHRWVQVRRTGGRLLFDDARKERFLQWFALTANVSFAAEQAGVCRQTISKHRLSDAAFAERYLDALSLAVPDLQARLLAHAQGRPKLDVVGDLEPPDDGEFDPQLALQILRELGRMLEGARQNGASTGGRPLKQGRAPRVASNEEVRAALTKALVAFGVRVSAERDAGGVDPPRKGEGDRTERGGGGFPPVETDRSQASAGSPCPLHHALHGPPPRAGEDLR